MSSELYDTDPGVIEISPATDTEASISSRIVTPDERQTLRRLAQSLHDELKPRCVAVFRYDAAVRRRTLCSFVEQNDAAANVMHAPLLDADLERAMIASMQSVTGSVDWEDACDSAAVLLVPISDHEALLGVACVWSHHGSATFSTDQITRASMRCRAVGAELQQATQRRRLRALNELGRALALTHDVSELYNRVFECARQVLELDLFSIALHDRRTGTIDFPLIATDQGEVLSPASTEIHEGPISQVLASGQSLRYQNASERAPGLMQVHAEPRDRIESSIHVPLGTSTGVFGVISTQSAYPDAYSDTDLETLDAIALQTSIALENARLETSSCRRAEAMSLLRRLSDSLTGLPSVDDTCSTVDREVSDMLALDALLVARLDRDNGERKPDILYTRTSPGLDPAFLAEAVDSHAASLIADARPRVVFPDDREQCSASIALIPMFLGERVTGLLALARAETLVWSDDDFELVETVASIAARAIDTARAHERIERESNNRSRVVEWQRSVVQSGEALAHTWNVELVIDTVATHLERLLPHRSLAIYVVDDEPDQLTAIRVRDLGLPVDVSMTITIGQGIVGTAVLDDTPLLSNNALLDEHSSFSRIIPTGAAERENLMAAPLTVGGGTIGAVAISRECPQPFTEEDFQLFTTLIPQLALVIHTSRLMARDHAIYRGTVRALTGMIDAKEPMTRGHSERVARYARDIARELNLPAADQDAIELAALLHDIGKVGVPDDILSKPGPLNESERAIMMEHAALGAEILSGARAREIDRLVPLIRHHHEWYQGGGYPDGLSGDDIPLGAAIIGVADAFDTMTTNRPYRNAMPVAEALEEARRYAATQFHPLAVDALTSTIETSSLSVDGFPGFTIAPAVSHITPVDVRPVSVLYRIAREIASIGDVDGFLNKTVRIISEELRYPNVSILLPFGDDLHLLVRADVAEAGTETIVGRLVPIDNSICGWVLRNATVVNVNDTTRDPRFFPQGIDHVRSELAAPLTVDGSAIGVLNVESSRPNAFTSLDERLLVAIASQIAPAVQLAQVHDDIKRAAQRDGLTGIYNHAAFFSRLEELLNDGERVAVFIFDVEGLKRVNDTAGHLAGDAALRRIAATLDLETRPQDLVARYGGDEFAVIVTDVDEQTAVEMAKRLQAAVKRLTWGPGAEHLSISVGVAVSGRDGTKATDLVSIADQRMYDVRRVERGSGRSHSNRRDYRAEVDQMLQESHQSR